MLPHGPCYPHSGKSGANHLPGALPVARGDFCAACLERWRATPGRCRSTDVWDHCFHTRGPASLEGTWIGGTSSGPLLGKAEGFQLWAYHGHNNDYVTTQQKGCSEAFLESQGLRGGVLETLTLLRWPKPISLPMLGGPPLGTILVSSP